LAVRKQHRQQSGFLFLASFFGSTIAFSLGYIDDKAFDAAGDKDIP